MTGRSVSSSGGSRPESRHTRRRASSGAVASDVVSSGGRTVASKGASDVRPREVRSRAEGAFVDARSMPSEDFVAHTLEQTSGLLRPKVVDFTERRKERTKANVRVAAVHVLIGLAIAVVVSTLAWVMFFSSVFKLDAKQIQISGANEWVSEQTVRDIVQRQVGTSLFLVSTDKVTDALENIPGVSSATASKHFPQGLNIEIQAQKPAALLKTGDTLTAVDHQSRVLNAVPKGHTEGIPVIEVDNAAAAVKSRAVQEAVKILGSLPESLRQSISSVSAATQDSITTTLADGHVIVWGDSSNLELKIADATTILGRADVIGDKKQVDVSAPYKPIIK